MKTTKKTISMCLMRAKSAYPHQIVNEQVLQTWFDLFKNEHDQVFNTAFLHTLKTFDYFPTFAKVQENIIKVKQALRARQGVKERSAPSEWTHILKYASRNDFKGVLGYVSKCRASKQALDAIGFDNIRLANVESELQWLRKEFLQIWENVNNQQESNEVIGLSHDQAVAQLENIQQKAEIKSLT